MGRKASEFIRVTTVLSWIDSYWYQWWLKSLTKISDKPVEEAERISKESAAFGTAVHKRVEQFLRKEEIIWGTERIDVCAATLCQWLKETKAELIQIDNKPSLEFEVKSKKLGLIGHFDALVKIGETLWLLDFKTSNAIKKGQFLQLAAYAKMLEEEYGISVNQGAILRVDKDPNKPQQFEFKEVHNLKEKHWPIFEKALSVYKYFNRKEN